jgi:magnesium-transporting ATPase (P-type)
MKADMPHDTLDTIQLCQNAGIKILMVSGDFEERCMSAAYSSGILSADTKLIRLTAKTEKNDLVKMIRKYISMTRGQRGSAGSVESSSSFDDYTPLKNSPAHASVDQQQTPNHRNSIFKSKTAGMLAVAVGNILDNAGGVSSDNTSYKKNATQVLSKLVGVEHEEQIDMEGLRIGVEECNYALILDGEALEKVKKDNDSFQMFMILLFCAKSVVGHGLYPMQCS